MQNRCRYGPTRAEELFFAHCVAHQSTVVRSLELAVAKHNIEPEARDARLRALKETEVGRQKAVDKIRERASLTRGPNMRW